MLGAIIGDIVGSRFEFHNIKSKDFALFTERSAATDDSIMTLAVAKAIMETDRAIKARAGEAGEFARLLEAQAVKTMRELGRRYPNRGYGGNFHRWLFSETPEPYGSYGNGAAMRITPVGDIARSEEEARLLSLAVTGVTHNHPEGFKGAEAVAVAVFMARQGALKDEIRQKISGVYYPLDFTIQGIRDDYRFDVSCQGTVPQAIAAFLESESFEDALRTAISLGGDSDTLAAITGSVAEAYYGVPEDLARTALSYLDGDLRAVYRDWAEFTAGRAGRVKFKVLTKYNERLTEADAFGEWIVDGKSKGTADDPIKMPYVRYGQIVNAFTDEFYRFSSAHPEFALGSYNDILARHGITWDDASMNGAAPDALDAQGILALIMGALRSEQFCEGALLDFLNKGVIQRWLRRLKEIDDENAAGPLY